MSMTSGASSGKTLYPISPAIVSNASGWSVSAWLLPALALCYALALALSISGSSFWTDEAFSAWLASHETLRSLMNSLFTGDSSDLQTGLYYIYLFFWAKLFGTGELALRSANIPFLLIFSLALVWTSWSVFKSRLAWLVAAMLPFVWHFASEARGYMAILAFSAASLAALLGFIRNNDASNTKKFPWICLTCVLLGSMFHMLFLLAAAPILWIAASAYFSDSNKPRWRQWIVPLATFTLPFCALAAFFVFTFTRASIGYDYPRPGLRQMASVLYELAGMFNFGPNRKLSLDFRPYLVPVIIGGLGLLLGAISIIGPALRNRTDRLVRTLITAALLCFIEVVTLSFALGKQFDARHLAALVPVVLFLLLGLITQAKPRVRVLAMVLLGGTWLVADLRGAWLPEYQKEDYRAAVRVALAIHNQTGAVIALASDPVGFAYYGLGVRGPAPCYPMVTSCEQAFRRVPWQYTVEGIDANTWSRPQIVSWLSSYGQTNRPVEILVQLDRAHRYSPWWPILASYSNAPRQEVHGFEIVLLSAHTQPGAN